MTGRVLPGLVVRPYEPRDIGDILRLFYDTVHMVNARDYLPAQLDAWAPGAEDARAWHESLAAHDALVAIREGMLAGFGDMDADGYLDRLYVHARCQRRGVGAALCGALEARSGARRFVVHASVTALPFFLARGYRTIRAQRVFRRGEALTNVVMEKEADGR